MPEAAQFSINDEYRKYLRELFKGIYALTRETHTKQLEDCLAGLAGVRDSAPKPRYLCVTPKLSAEPLATCYLRRAKSYAFVRSIVEKAFGSGALRDMKRYTPDGAVPRSLAEEVAEMESVLFGAYASIYHDLGMPLEDTPSLHPERDLARDAEIFSAWADRVAEDPDISRDVRMMVPIFYDLARRKIKVWVFLGWRQKPLRVGFDKWPDARVFDRDGRDAGDRVHVIFRETSEILHEPVVREVYVTKILDRNDFRKLCDRHKSERAILHHLK